MPDWPVNDDYLEFQEMKKEQARDYKVRILGVAALIISIVILLCCINFWLPLPGDGEVVYVPPVSTSSPS